MTTLVTGSSGHLGDALVRTLRAAGEPVRGLDVTPSPTTDVVASIVARDALRDALAGAHTVLHTATLHKPHVATHARQDFVDVNITGTLNLLEESVAQGVRAFVFTSTTSVYGFALQPPPQAPTVWVDEDLAPIPKNIYGVTKLAAENLCALFQRKFGLPCLILRTSRFFPEADDDAAMRAAYADANIKLNELTHRRVDVADVVEAHRLAAAKAPAIGFGRYVISATPPFERSDAARMRHDLAAVLAERVPQAAAVYAARGWRVPSGLGRVYDNAHARAELGWAPQYDFLYALRTLAAGSDDFRSPLAQAIGAKGYHAEVFADGPYPVD